MDDFEAISIIYTLRNDRIAQIREKSTLTVGSLASRKKYENLKIFLTFSDFNFGSLALYKIIPLIILEL